MGAALDALMARMLDFDRFRFKVPTRELLRVAEDGSEAPIPLGLRAADVLLFFLERPGELVTKSEIMQAVWPDAVVEESNLTVHISAIRRALDDGRDGQSCIQNVPRRGYRFTLDVNRGGAAPEGQGHRGLPGAPQDAQVRPASSASPEALAATPVVTASANTAGRLIRNWRMHAPTAAAVLLVAAATIAFVGWGVPALLQPVQPAEPHRASIVALPFANASGDPKDEEVAAALTEDVTVSLDQIPGAYVIARSTAQTMAERKLPLPRLGSELGVRYVLEGNMRRSPDGLELSVQLSEAASGASIWSRQLKGSTGESSEFRSQVARTLLFPLRIAFMDAEADRLNRLPIAELTAADLLFQVTASFNHQPSTPARTAANVAKLERALQLDPASSELMIILARQIILPILTFGEIADREERLARARSLADKARALAAGSEGLQRLRAIILRAEGRADEAVAASTRLLQAHADSVPYRVELGFALIQAGRSAEAIPLFQDAIRLNHGDASRFAMYQGLGAALIRVGRSDEAIEWLRAAQQESSGAAPFLNRRLAVSYAYAGKLEDARRELREFTKLRPWQTLHLMRHSVYLDAGAAKEWNYEIAGLAIAGLRDHVPEDADPGLPIDKGLRSHNRFSPTPVGAPGVSVVRTSELKALIDGAANGLGEPPLLLSTNCTRCLDIDIPGAVGVPTAYFRSPLDDQARQGLKSWLDQQLNGQTSRRLITFSWNAERWHARNLALELIALGYPNVSWYRGGVEAWDVAGYPVVEKR
jgi:DNA-binding winged helix-turn-helix (wHTH) protein/TolB-like protein/tetratricopeptide (TPR) repeat protein